MREEDIGKEEWSEGGEGRVDGRREEGRNRHWRKGGSDGGGWERGSEGEGGREGGPKRGEGQTVREREEEGERSDG